MKLHQNSKIIATKSKIHNNALHISVELWGWTGNMDQSVHPRLLNFWRKTENLFGVAPHDQNTSNSDYLEFVPTEEFSKQIWNVPIQDDWELLTDIQETKVYAEIVHKGKMFFTVRFDK